MDALKGFGELGLGSRLKRLSEQMMKETQMVYNHFEIDFDPYLFPVFKIIDNCDAITNAEIGEKLQISQPAITQVVNKLIKKELVSITFDNKDKRKKIITISNNGNRLLSEIKPIWLSIDAVIKDYCQHSSKSLIDHINHLEDKLINQPMNTTIINQVKKNIKNTIKIISFEERYSKDFLRFKYRMVEDLFLCRTL